MPTALDESRPVRWGILGAGGIAADMGAQIAASPGSEVAAVGARDAGRAAAFADRLGVGRSYGSYADLVADPELDVIYVATTNAQHHEHALQALRAGKPVLVEKAFTLNARQARDVVDAADRRGLFCMEAMWLRFTPLIRRAQRIIADGRLGDVISVRAELSAVFPFDPAHRLFDLALGGGALLDLGVYPIHLAWLLLGRPDSMQAAGSLSPTGSDETAALQWGYADGRFAQLACTTRGRSPFAALICGTDGWLEISPRIHRPTRLTIGSGSAVEVIDAEPTGFGPQIAEVERCLRAGSTQSPIMPTSDTIAILDIIDAARAVLGVHYAADEE